MNYRGCSEYKEMGIWKSQLCRWCIERNCINRAYSYDLAGRRKSMITDVKTKIDVTGQLYWDWFGDTPEDDKRE